EKSKLTCTESCRRSSCGVQSSACRSLHGRRRHRVPLDEGLHGRHETSLMRMILAFRGGRRFRECHVACECIRCAGVNEAQIADHAKWCPGAPRPCPARAENPTATLPFVYDVGGIP